MYIFEISGILRIHLRFLKAWNRFGTTKWIFIANLELVFSPFDPRESQDSGNMHFFGPTRKINPCRGEFLGDISIK